MNQRIIRLSGIFRMILFVSFLFGSFFLFSPKIFAEYFAPLTEMVEFRRISTDMYKIASISALKAVTCLLSAIMCFSVRNHPEQLTGLYHLSLFFLLMRIVNVIYVLIFDWTWGNIWENLIMGGLELLLFVAVFRERNDLKALEEAKAEEADTEKPEAAEMAAAEKTETVKPETEETAEAA